MQILAGPHCKKNFKRALHANFHTVVSTIWCCMLHAVWVGVGVHCLGQSMHNLAMQIPAMVYRGIGETGRVFIHQPNLF